MLAFLALAYAGPDAPPADTTEGAVQPAADAPAVDAPAVDAPAVDAPTVDAPTLDDPTVDDPTADQPTVDEPAAQEPVVAKEPVSENASAPATPVAAAAAVQVAAPVVVAKPAPANPVRFKVSGLYTAWGLTQNNFLLGKDHPLDDAAYTVQMLRLKLQVQKDTYGVVARVDGAQGWWGADNSPNTGTAVGVDANGDPVASETYNPGAFFTNKDTNYAVHIDQAYAWADLKVGIPIQVRVGRQSYRLGHKLVLDFDYDGVQVEFKPSDTVHLSAWWAKISEGLGSFTTPRGALMSDDDVNADADLAVLVADFKPGAHKIQVFGAGYWDRSGDGTATYFPQGLGYLRSRHQPNISSVYVGGISADLSFPDAGSEIQAEGDILFGSDDVNNTDYAGGKLDMNDGSLFGWNLWLRLDQTLVKSFHLGAAFGMGSGDNDKTGGSGNVNKIQTMGFFPLTNVWEDSVMPDIAGISPQGLGSPVSRGYRELENTMAAQVFTSIRPIDQLKIDVSGTYLRATTAIQGFDATGSPTGAGSSDIGLEFDLNTTVVVTKGLSAKALTGVFLPGVGAGNLINGNADSLDPAWEIKLVGVAKF